MAPPGRGDMMSDELVCNTYDNNWCQSSKPRKMGAVVVYLSCGDVHVCRSETCSLAQPMPDGAFVCPLSGLVCGKVRARCDHGTGRNSSDPDMQVADLSAYLRGKRDHIETSTEAFGAVVPEPQHEPAPASSHDLASTDEKALVVRDEEGEVIARAPSRPPTKRGARVVGAGVRVSRRGSSCKGGGRRSGKTPESWKSMLSDAEAIIVRLSCWEKKVKEKPDLRLEDGNFVFTAAVKRYLKQCSASSKRPSLDMIHNIGLEARRLATAQRARRLEEAKRECLLLKVRVREQVTRLLVSLWIAALSCPYMSEARRGSDSFRPFVAGALYGLKRGVALATGEYVLPCSPQLTLGLPALRSTAAFSAAKALHSSSHRGLSTLHRCVASCEESKARKIFANCVLIAAQLQTTMESGVFDVV